MNEYSKRPKKIPSLCEIYIRYCQTKTHLTVQRSLRQDNIMHDSACFYQHLCTLLIIKTDLERGRAGISPMRCYSENRIRCLENEAAKVLTLAQRVRQSKASSSKTVFTGAMFSFFQVGSPVVGLRECRLCNTQYAVVSHWGLGSGRLILAKSQD